MPDNLISLLLSNTYRKEAKALENIVIHPCPQKPVSYQGKHQDGTDAREVIHMVRLTVKVMQFICNIISRDFPGNGYTELHSLKAFESQTSLLT